MFHGLAPVGDGFGMKMLKKMGWKEGQPIGKQGEGHVEPISVGVKMDRSGMLRIIELGVKCSVCSQGSDVVLNPCTGVA